MTASYYASKEWKVLKASVMVRDGQACQKCGRNDDLVVHHIEPRTKGGADAADNLITLCKSCHFKAHMMLAPNYGIPTPRYNPTDEELREMGLEI
jgi:5-methylcytosine-specific restriction endonuclease McrA